MRVIVVTPPQPVLDWPAAKAHLRLDSDDDQTLVEAMIAAATAHLDGPDGWLGRAIGPQTLEARYDGFDPVDPLALPFPPTIAVQSIRYLDPNGADTLLDAAGYAAYGNIVEAAFGASWPSVRFGRETVRVRYQAGYVADPMADPLVPALPPAIRAALMMMVADLYENRDTTVDARASAAAVPMSTTVERLLSPFQVWC